MSRRLTVDDLERWELFGAGWRVVELGDRRAVVDLCACTGETVERHEVTDARLVTFLAGRPTVNPEQE